MPSAVAELIVLDTLGKLYARGHGLSGYCRCGGPAALAGRRRYGSRRRRRLRVERDRSPANTPATVLHGLLIALVRAGASAQKDTEAAKRQQRSELGESVFRQHLRISSTPTPPYVPPSHAKKSPAERAWRVVGLGMRYPKRNGEPPQRLSAPGSGRHGLASERILPEANDDIPGFEGPVESPPNCAECSSSRTVPTSLRRSSARRGRWRDRPWRW
jgi:hypothetical protein